MKNKHPQIARRGADAEKINVIMKTDIEKAYWYPRSKYQSSSSSSEYLLVSFLKYM